MSESSEENAYNLAIAIATTLLGVLGLGAIVVVLSVKNRPSILRSRLRMPVALALLALAIGTIILIRTGQIHRATALGLILIAIWSIGAAASLITASLWRRFLPKEAITPRLGSNELKVLRSKSDDPDEAFIGRSYLSAEPVFLSEREREMHMLVCGSTGSGKTTALKSLFIDAMRKRQPVLIIDPKGNNKTIDEFRTFAREAGPIDTSFKVFSIINPEISASYNPLGRGTSMQIRDRIMGAFEWSEPFYKHQASAWLGLAIDLLRGLSVEVTIHRLHRLLIDPKELDELEDQCAKQKDPSLTKELQTRLRALAKYDRKNLDGLISQLRDLDNLEFGKILKPEGQSIIELKQVLEGREVAYFQLNTMAYEGAAKAIGRLILQDLKALASQIHGGQESVEPIFFPIFVDEFGSFAFEGFIDFLKMSRDVKFANHLFFQSLADLDVVSPEFKSQVQQNCLTKVIMRTDDPQEVDFWSGVAGTRDAIESSYQVEMFLGFKMKTGQGNMRLTKQMRIEHDVFKRLRVGQAVVIQKAPAREDLIQLWNPPSGCEASKVSDR